MLGTHTHTYNFDTTIQHKNIRKTWSHQQVFRVYSSTECSTDNNYAQYLHLEEEVEIHGGDPEASAAAGDESVSGKQVFCFGANECGV